MYLHNKHHDEPHCRSFTLFETVNSVDSIWYYLACSHTCVQYGTVVLFTMSGRVKELEKRRILDEAARRRRARKALEALEQDNYQVCSVQNSRNGVLSKIIISTIRAFSNRFSLGTCHCNFSHTIAVGLFPSPYDKEKKRP